MPRMVVLGTSGAGKTTLARALARRLSVPHIELDEHYWLPDWQERSIPDFRARVDEATQAESWVVDGNYRSKVEDLIWPRATHLVWLNYSYPTIMSRVMRRTVRRVFLRTRMWSAQNREDFAKSFLSRDSVIYWAATTYHERRRHFREIFDHPNTALSANVQRVELTTPRQTVRWLRAF